jgi:hypothetical protein
VKRIAQGENALIRRNLKQADGSNLLLSTLSTFTAEIIQAGNVIELLTYPSAKLREGTTTSQAELEVSTDVSAQFRKGRVSIRWTLVAPSVVFTSEDIQKDIITEDVLDVV